ncbi:thiamine pyrophosphate-dependent enzyme [Tomitella biformata]|uniref:thiamine pyrophosphate-dependent enzyme n=1 Tax=Tomitella biformata TaxID=630403 RepID=UPI0004631FDF|nr:thiamine pyrophosphate-dependent enzyme [Tomitella biformata]
MRSTPPGQERAETIEILRPDGVRLDSGEHARLIADVDGPALLGLYRDLLLLRRVDNECMALARQGELCLWAPIAGQESTLVGSLRGLPAQDYLFISYREATLAYLRGATPAQLLPMWRGSALGGWAPDEINTTNPSIIVGAQGLHATGYAMAASLQGADVAAVAYFGDGATSQGDLSEALNIAAVHIAPVIFICQNNQYAISVPVDQQSAVPPVQRASGFGIPAVQADGNDVLAMLAVSRQAAAHVHGGHGPFFIEAVTYRMGPHTTNDDPSRYRSSAETAHWAERDPIDRLRRHLQAQGHLDDAATSRIEDEIDTAAAQLRSACLSLPDPTAASLFEHVYAGPHALLQEERADYLAFQQRLEGVRP